MKIAVIGGGLGGLAAARALVAAGHDPHVLEAASRTGGVLHTSTSEGYVREQAASSFLGSPPRGARALCEQLGVPVEQASPRAKRRWIFIDGKLRALPRNPFEMVRTDLLTWRGKLDLLREPLRPPRDAGDESVYAFAARRFGAETARAVVAPFVTGIYAADAHDVSLEAAFPKLAELDAADRDARARRVDAELEGETLAATLARLEARIRSSSQGPSSLLGAASARAKSVARRSTSDTCPGRACATWVRR